VIARGYRGPGSGLNPMLLIALVLLVLYFLTGSLQSPIQKRRAIRSRSSRS